MICEVNVMDWKKVKEIVLEDTGTSLKKYVNKYRELDALGLFDKPRWWIAYEEAMMELGVSWDACYAKFPMLIKFLLDLSKGHTGFEVFKVNRELALMFNGILYNKESKKGKSEGDSDMDEGDIIAKASSCKQLKFIQCIFEMCGLALEPRKEFQKMYSLVGAGGDGKSVLLGLFDSAMNGTINGNLCGHTPIDELGDKFALQSLVNQTCNISDDTNDKMIVNTGIIKTLIGAGGTGTGITVNRKNKEDFFWNDPQILLIIAGNKLPRFKDTTDGMMRRVIYMPFKNSLKNRSGDMDLKLSAKLRAWDMNLAVLFNVGRYAVADARFRGELTEMNESVFIKNRFLEGEKTEMDRFIEHVELKHVKSIEEWLLGENYWRSKLGGR